MRSIISALGVAFILSYSSGGFAVEAGPMVESQNFQSIPPPANQSDELQSDGFSLGSSGGADNPQTQNISTIQGGGTQQENSQFSSAIPSSSNGTRAAETADFAQGLNTSFSSQFVEAQQPSNGPAGTSPKVGPLRCSQAYMPLSVQDLQTFSAPDGNTPSAGDPLNTTVPGGRVNSNQLRARALTSNMGQKSMGSPLPPSQGTSANETESAVQVACKAMNDPQGAFCKPESCERLMTASKCQKILDSQSETVKLSPDIIPYVPCEGTYYVPSETDADQKTYCADKEMQAYLCTGSREGATVCQSCVKMDDLSFGTE